MVDDKPRVTVVTSTYNRPKLLEEAAESLFNQTYPHWQWWLVLDGADEETARVAVNRWARGYDMESAYHEFKVRVFVEMTTEEQRWAEYRPSAIINKYYPRIQTPYIFWLSDDDLMEVRCLEALAGYLDDHPHADIAYGKCGVVREVGETGQYRFDRWLHYGSDIGYGCDVQPNCVIDGGQILQTKRSYDALNGWQFPTQWGPGVDHVDGTYMNELAKQFTFYYVDEPVIVHRCTHLSTHQKGVEE